MTEPLSGPLTVEVWSDVVCPWCRIGRANLLSALADFEHADEVAVRYRSFELEPQAPTVMESSVVDHLAARLGTGSQQVEAMVDAVTARGAEAGVEFRFDIARGGNTFDAHRLLHLAHDRQCQDVVKDALMRAYFVEGRSIGDRATLEEVAVECGLDRDEVRSVLASDAYADRVLEDEEEARALIARQAQAPSSIAVGTPNR